VRGRHSVPGRAASAIDLLFVALFAAILIGVAAYAVASMTGGGS
jgi:hypothetical protein